MRSVRIAAATALALSCLVVGAGAAAASPPPSHSSTCTGTLTAPGVLAGHFRGNVTIEGFCLVNGGDTDIGGNLVLTPGSALNATFALNDVAGTGKSSLDVWGDMVVGNGAVLALGCEPNFSPCADDPAAGTGGTLTGDNTIHGDLASRNALGVIVHATHIHGDVTQVGGGGGLSCNVPTTGVFSELHSPVFSDYENNSVGGNLVALGIRSCYFGGLRNHVRGNVVFSYNTFGDPDASEVLANHVGGNLSCADNLPAVQFGDSASVSNQVEGHASGQCAFYVRQPNPSPSGPPTPISVRS